MRERWLQLPLKKKIIVVLTAVCLVLTAAYLPERWPLVLTKEEIKEAEFVSDRETEVLAHDTVLTDRGGQTVSMQDLYNKKPVFVYFWLTWSDAAREDFPLLEAMYQKYGRDIYFVIICLDRDQRTRDTLSARWDHELPLYFADMETAGLYNVYEVPLSYMLKRGGTIIDKHTGTWERRQLEYLLAKSLR